MSFPCYPKYKPSGVEWLGDVPEHWDVVPLRHLVECLDGKRVPLNAEQRATRGGSVPYWGANCVVDYIDEALVSEAVVLLGEDGAPFFDKPKPVAFFVDQPIWPNNHVHVLRPCGRVLGEYITHILNATDYANFIQGSTRDKLTQSSMNGIPVLAPPPREQRAIVAFLDRETAKIDALVAEQERLIELLKEKRQAVISQAVTKGLDTTAPMKPSGIEWLGDVPKHWEVKRLRHLLVRNDGGAWGGEPVDEQDPIVLRSTEQTVDGRWTIEEPARRRLSAQEVEDTLLAEGDLLITKSSGSELHIGKTTLVTSDVAALCCCYSNFMQRLRTSKDLLPTLAWYVLNNKLARLQFALLSSTSTGLANLNGTTISDLIMAVPPRVEQEALVRWLETETASVDALVAAAGRAIALLQERRSALISAAVTGQIDVRNAVAVEVA